MTKDKYARTGKHKDACSRKSQAPPSTEGIFLHMKNIT